MKRRPEACASQRLHAIRARGRFPGGACPDDAVISTRAGYFQRGEPVGADDQGLSSRSTSRAEDRRHMTHRLREAMKNRCPDWRSAETVAADETFIGPEPRFPTQKEDRPRPGTAPPRQDVRGDRRPIRIPVRVVWPDGWRLDRHHAFDEGEALAPTRRRPLDDQRFAAPAAAQDRSLPPTSKLSTSSRSTATSAR